MTPRMRTVAEAAAELRRMDPATAVTAYYIRQLVLTGAIPHLQAGTKRLINMDQLLTYLSNPSPEGHPPVELGVIRPIKEA